MVPAPRMSLSLTGHRLHLNPSCHCSFTVQPCALAAVAKLIRYKVYMAVISELKQHLGEMPQEHMEGKPCVLSSNFESDLMPKRHEIAIQCDAPQEWEPMTDFEKLFKRKCLAQILKPPIEHNAPPHLSVQTLFSGYQDADKVDAWAATLEVEDVHMLARWSLGTHVAGVRVVPSVHRPVRRVEDRYVIQTSMLAKRADFRKALIVSCNRLSLEALQNHHSWEMVSARWPHGTQTSGIY